MTGKVISLQAAIDAIQNEWYECINYDGSGIEIADDTIRVIENLPSVIAWKHGEWVIRDGMLFCTACNKRQFGYIAFDNVDWRPPYCPNCGAYMRGDADADS